MLAVHDLHADSLTAAVVYTHDLQAKETHYDNLVVIHERDLPSPGKENIDHGAAITANEVHAHHVDVNVLRAGTLYTVKKPK